MVDILYEATKKCGVCDGAVKVTKVRSRLSLIKQDSDFCTYYKEVNPNYYAVFVCPNCGYAAQDTYFEDAPLGIQDIKKFLDSRTVNVNYSGNRTLEQALSTYKLAIFFAEMISALPSRLGGLYLKLAWLFRENEQDNEELMALEKAQQCYEQAFLREKMPIGGMSQLTVEYLCGELLRRIGRFEEALTYLGKVVANPQAKLEKRIYDMARESWNLARQAQKEQQTG
ncbi:MAG: hypothetical protein H6Q74_1758 [Firmicutes bacterium]|nr:hypothetical protein [Bacillota bacterium]